MKILVFDGKILRMDLLTNVQVRESGENFEAVAFQHAEGAIILNAFDTEAAAKGYVNKIGKAMSDIDEAGNIVLVDKGVANA